MKPLVLVLALSAAACSPPLRAVIPAKPAHDAAVQVLDALDPLASEEPDTVLLAARAYTYLALDEPAYETQARALLDRLASMTAAPGVVGWGLSFAWDAFGDGTENPASTIYSYTTAAAGLAFLDGYAAFGDARYFELAVGAAETLVTDLCCWVEGEYASIWYSNQPADMQPGRQVHNVSGLTLALLSRLADLGHPIDAVLSDKLTAYLVASQGQPWMVPEHAATSNWPYSADGRRANDLIHETFIIEGLMYRNDAQETVRRAVEGVLEVHFSDDGHPDEQVHTRGSLGWGPPAGLYILSNFPAHRTRVDRIAQVLMESIAADGTSTLLEENHERALAWYALGLARYAAAAS